MMKYININKFYQDILHSSNKLEKVIFYLFVLFAFSLPLSRASISLFSIIFISIYLFSGEYHKKLQEIKESPVLKALFLFLIYITVSLVWTTDMQEGINNTRLFGYLLLIPIISYYLKRKNIQSIITAFLFGMFISEIISYGMYFELWTIKGHGPEYPSPFMHHILYSIFLALTASILLYRLLSKHFSLTEKIFFLFFFLSVTGNLFLSIGRTGQVAFIFSIITVFILHYKLSFRSVLSSILLIVIIFLTAYQSSPNFQKRVYKINKDIQLIRQGNLKSSLGVRISFWIISYELIKKDPFFGVGIGDIDLEKSNYIDKMDSKYKIDIKFCKGNHLHNQYLMITVAGGIVGLTLFMIFIYRMLALPIENKELKGISILFFIILLLSFLTEAVLHRQFSLILFVFFSGLFIASSKKEVSYEKN